MVVVASVSVSSMDIATEGESSVEADASPLLALRGWCGANCAGACRESSDGPEGGTTFGCVFSPNARSADEVASTGNPEIETVDIRSAWAATSTAVESARVKLGRSAPSPRLPSSGASATRSSTVVDRAFLPPVVGSALNPPCAPGPLPITPPSALLIRLIPKPHLSIPPPGLLPPPPAPAPKLLEGEGSGCEPVMKTDSERGVWLPPRPREGGTPTSLVVGGAVPGAVGKAGFCWAACVAGRRKGSVEILRVRLREEARRYLMQKYRLGRRMAGRRRLRARRR